jgi:hypothetical protein
MGQDDGQPQLVQVFVTNGVRTSAGTGPGARELPRAEAAALVVGKVAIYGPCPPAGFGALR